jgi:hypothetical protein
MNLLSYSGRECSLVKYVESSLAMPIQFFKWKLPINPFQNLCYNININAKILCQRLSMVGLVWRIAFVFEAGLTMLPWLALNSWAQGMLLP